MTLAKRIVPPLIILALVATFAVAVLGGGEQKSLTAYFPRTISIYEGSDVRVLGVPVGKVDSVTPEGTRVKVGMHYDPDVQVPSSAQAVIIAPSIVGDRYIQLTPVYDGKGAVLADGDVLEEGSTSVPLELDQIYSSLDRLSVALGPDGANKDGALTDVLEQTAQNFAGQGTTFKQTITDFSQLSSTLDDNKEELFGSAAALEGFVSTLAKNDKTVRRFNTSLSSVSTTLSGERQELRDALANLAVALDEVGTFVKDNKVALSSNIKGLNRVAKVLVKQRAALDETLNDAPVALNNLALTYNPQAGTLDTNANLGELGNQIASDPTTLLCGLVNQTDKSGSACDLIQSLPLPRTGPFGAGTGSSSGDRFDPTLGGLVEVAP